jgi:hypothetical protein
MLRLARRFGASFSLDDDRVRADIAVTAASGNRMPGS